MAYKVTIAGAEVELAWTKESEMRFHFRMGEVGGEPSPAQLTNPKTVTTALFKVLWGLLPGPVFARFPDPESLYVAVDHEKEGAAIYAAIRSIYKDRFPTAEKKSTSKKSRSRKSNSG